MPGTYKFIIEYVGGKCTIETKEMVKGIVEQSVRLRKRTLIFKGIDVGSILFIRISNLRGYEKLLTSIQVH